MRVAAELMVFEEEEVERVQLSVGVAVAEPELRAAVEAFSDSVKDIVISELSISEALEKWYLVKSLMTTHVEEEGNGCGPHRSTRRK